jgi:hypothetical protein
MCCGRAFRPTGQADGKRGQHQHGWSPASSGDIAAFMKQLKAPIIAANTAIEVVMLARSRPAART